LKLPFFIFLFGTIIIVAAICFALFFWNKEKPSYYRFVFSFIVLGLLISIDTAVNNYQIWFSNNKVAIAIEQLLVLIQFTMLGFFFLKILNKSKFLKRIKCLLLLSILIHITLLILVLLKNTDIRPYISSNLFLLIFCFFYFRDLMINKPTLILRKSSAFWIVIGIFYSSCIGFPVNSLVSFIPKTQELVNLRLQIFSLFNLALIVLYLFIIKSYLCLRHPQNS
jgi:hypothetical protein